MLLTQANLDNIKKSHVVTFNKAKDKSKWKAKLESLKFLFAETQSDGRDEEYGFVIDGAKWREWLGDRQWQNIKLEKIRIENKSFEKSYALLATDIEDDRTGMILGVVRNAGSDWPKVKYQMVLNVLKNNPKCFDGKVLFGSHSYGKNSFNNLGSKKLTVANYEAASLLMSSWKGHDGEKMGIEPTHIMVARDLKATAFTIFQSEKVDNNNNPHYNEVEVVVNPELEDGQWFLVDGSDEDKPVVLQIRKEAEAEMETDLKHVKRTGKMPFMGDGRCGAGALVPHKIYKSTGTVD